MYTHTHTHRDREREAPGIHIECVSRTNRKRADSFVKFCLVPGKPLKWHLFRGFTNVLNLLTNKKLYSMMKLFRMNSESRVSDNYLFQFSRKNVTFCHFI